MKEINITTVYGKEFVGVFNLRKDSWVIAFPFALSSLENLILLMPGKDYTETELLFNCKFLYLTVVQIFKCLLAFDQFILEIH